MADKEGAAASSGLLHSLRSLASTLYSAVHTRLEILATELEEERLWLERLLVLAFAALFCICMGALLAVMFIVAYFWDTYRLESIGALTLAFLIPGAALVWTLRDKVHARGKPFPATRGELAKDRASLEDSQF
jgi:uncharacterized membrane protein YqjE